MAKGKVVQVIGTVVDVEFPGEELLASGKSKVIATSAQQVLEEYLRNNQNITSKVEGRLAYIIDRYAEHSRYLSSKRGALWFQATVEGQGTC
jgi:F0F1-type ATP synthase beta subunit